MIQKPPEETPETPETRRERGRLWVLGSLALAAAVLLVGDVVLYSTYQQVSSRVEGQDHRIERLQNMLTDMLKVNKNAEKIEKIEAQVNNIEVQVTDLTTTIKAQDAKAELPEPPKKKKRGR